MILQYKGYNNVWCYEEARHIQWANVELVTIREEFENKFNEAITPEDKLQVTCDHSMAIYNKICDDTHCDLESINDMTTARLADLNNVCIVHLGDKDVNATYIFEQGRGVYILNGRGQTVQRIA